MWRDCVDHAVSNATRNWGSGIGQSTARWPPLVSRHELPQVRLELGSPLPHPKLQTWDPSFALRSTWPATGNCLQKTASPLFGAWVYCLLLEGSLVLSVKQLPTLALQLWLLKLQFTNISISWCFFVRSTLLSLISEKCLTRLCWILPMSAISFNFCLRRVFLTGSADLVSNPSNINLALGYFQRQHWIHLIDLARSSSPFFTQWAILLFFYLSSFL